MKVINNPDLTIMHVKCSSCKKTLDITKKDLDVYSYASSSLYSFKCPFCFYVNTLLSSDVPPIVKEKLL